VNSKDTYLEAARAYADGVRVLFAPSGQETGERGGRGPQSYVDLAEQAERLAPLSAQVTEEAAARLAEATPGERIEVETALLAKALTDLEICGYLLQASQDEEARTEFSRERRAERRATSIGTTEPYLKLLLGVEEPDPAREERMARRPRNVGAARAELTLQTGDALALISEQAGDTGKTALEGLVNLGSGEVARAVGALGLDFAQVLGLAEEATRLHSLFRDYLVKAYEALMALLGPKLTESVGEQVKGWVERIAGQEPVDALLERLYETRQTGDELRLLIRESHAALETFVTAIEQVGGLDDAFRKQTGLVDRIMSTLRYLTLIPAAALPQGKLLLAIGYVMMGAYVILVGGDYVDARRLGKLDRVPGVRRVVEMNLASGQGG
jgi:hypothetical protein